MKMQEIRFSLKDGREALLRSPVEEDADSTLEHLYRSAGETEFILQYPEECGADTAEDIKRLFEEKNDSRYDVMMLCLVDGKVAGSGEISFHKELKIRHRADLGITIGQAYWNQGIGSRMLKEMLGIAQMRQEIRQVELEFVEGNTRARHLYEKMGFRIVGEHPNAICLKDGTMLKEYLMIREME